MPRLLWNRVKTLFLAPAKTLGPIGPRKHPCATPHLTDTNRTGTPLGIPVTYSVFFFFLSNQGFAYSRIACPTPSSLDSFGLLSTLLPSVTLGVVSHLCLSEKRDLVTRKTIDFPLWPFLPWQSKSHWKPALIEHDGLKNRGLTVDMSVVKLCIMLW